VSEGFITTRNGSTASGGVLFKITTPKGAKLALGNPQEFEVILPPGTVLNFKNFSRQRMHYGNDEILVIEVEASLPEENIDPNYLDTLSARHFYKLDTPTRLLPGQGSGYCALGALTEYDTIPPQEIPPSTRAADMGYLQAHTASMRGLPYPPR
jgi:hypothetical protein